MLTLLVSDRLMSTHRLMGETPELPTLEKAAVLDIHLV